MKKRIVFLTDFFLPGINSGGPVVTIKNTIDHFADSFDFYVICLNHDLGSKELYPYPVNTFIEFENYKCMYINGFCKSIFKYVLEYGFDIIYCLGTYSKYTRYFCLHSKNKLLPRIIIAPMGNFSKGALNIKRVKKKFFFFVYKPFFLSNKIEWSFSSKKELNEATKVLGNKILKNSFICPDSVCFETKTINESFLTRKNMFVFVSRICKNKGLFESILKLIKTRYPCCLDVYGSIEDKDYWKKCVLETKNTNVELRYFGQVLHENIGDIFAKYHFFLLNTHGENFGHVIFESLNNGCLPLVTPEVTQWDDLLNKIKNYSLINENYKLLFELTNDEKKMNIKQCYLLAKKYSEESNNGFLRLIYK